MEKQIKVIICADDGEWSRENTDALASRGAQVMTVNRNGTALLTKIRDEKPDVVVMDLFMAGVDALGVMHAVKAEGLQAGVHHHGSVFLKRFGAAGHGGRRRLLRHPAVQ